jgi:hypothetical protein
MQVTYDSSFSNRASQVRLHLIILPIIYGVTGSALLQGVYVLILSILNTFGYAWQQFVNLSPWMVPLVAGFGVQVGIFFYTKGYISLAKSGVLHKGPVVASAGLSTGSMIACCAHHAVEVLPILGLSAATVFLSRFQNFLLGVGIVSNLVGTMYMLYNVKKHKLFLEGGAMAFIASWNMKAILQLTVVAGTISLIALFISQI